jgi:large subunit ribosomal protein L14e
VAEEFFVVTQKMIIQEGEKKMFEVGKICLKIAGRDAGKLAVIVDILDENTVLIDGEVRRRKCNLRHLEPINKKVDIKKNANHNDVLKALGLKEEKKGSKDKKEKGPRPKRERVKKKYSSPKPEKKKVEKKTKKEEKKAEKK